MLELQSPPTPEGYQPLSGDEKYETIFSRQSCYSKGLGWGPKPKSRKSTAFNSSSTYEQEMYSREVSEHRLVLKMLTA